MGKAVPCPVCGAPATVTENPFCTDRCREVDLNRWLGGAYSIPAVDQSPPDNGSERREDEFNRNTQGAFSNKQS